MSVPGVADRETVLSTGMVRSRIRVRRCESEPTFVRDVGARETRCRRGHAADAPTSTRGIDRTNDLPRQDAGDDLRPRSSREEQSEPFICQRACIQLGHDHVDEACQGEAQGGASARTQTVGALLVRREQELHRVGEDACDLVVRSPPHLLGNMPREKEDVPTMRLQEFRDTVDALAMSQGSRGVQCVK
jgi:hypothetical protein